MPGRPPPPPHVGACMHESLQAGARGAQGHRAAQPWSQRSWVWTLLPQSTSHVTSSRTRHPTEPWSPRLNHCLSQEWPSVSKGLVVAHGWCSVTESLELLSLALGAG